MKMSAADYAILHKAITSVMANFPNSRDTYQTIGHTPRRWRWDMLWKAVDTKLVDSGMVHKYNDAHIDTALRRITGTGATW